MIPFVWGSSGLKCKHTRTPEQCGVVDKELARGKVGNLGTREDGRILGDSGWCKGFTVSDTDVLQLLSGTLSPAAAAVKRACV